jgi:hypothetical protein
LPKKSDFAKKSDLDCQRNPMPKKSDFAKKSDFKYRVFQITVRFIMLLLNGGVTGKRVILPGLTGNAPIGDVETKIQKLTELQNRFPDQSQVTQPRIDKWNRVHTQLTRTQKEIHFQIERAYVIYKTEQEIEGTQQFTATAKALIQKADEALKTAKSMTEVIEESANY